MNKPHITSMLWRGSNITKAPRPNVAYYCALTGTFTGKGTSPNLAYNNWCMVNAYNEQRYGRKS